MTIAKRNSVDVLCIYTIEDTFIHDELVEHLSGLRIQNLISHWHDWEISAGMDSSETLNRFVDEAHIILLLISQPFLDSPLIHSEQIKTALERHENKQASVIPILVSSTEWMRILPNSLRAFPVNALPILQWPDRDEALSGIARSIHITINNDWALDALHQETRQLSGGLQQSLYEIERILQDIQQYEQISQQDFEDFEKTLTMLRSSMITGLDQFKQLAGE